MSRPSKKSLFIYNLLLYITISAILSAAIFGSKAGILLTTSSMLPITIAIIAMVSLLVCIGFTMISVKWKRPKARHDTARAAGAQDDTLSHTSAQTLNSEHTDTLPTPQGEQAEPPVHATSASASNGDDDSYTEQETSTPPIPLSITLGKELLLTVRNARKENDEQIAQSVKALIDRGAAVSLTDLHCGFTALHYAADQGFNKTTAVLLEHNALLNLQSERIGMVTPLMLALMKGHHDIALHLVKAGASLELQSKRDDFRAIHYAALNGDTEAVKAMIAKGVNLNAESTYGETALILALHEQHIEAAMLIIKAGAEVNLALRSAALAYPHAHSRQLKGGTSPLHVAATSDANLEAVKLLLEYGANIDAVNHYVDTPLTVATTKQATANIEFLLRAGARIELGDSIMKTSKKSTIKDSRALIAYMRTLNAQQLNIFLEKATEYWLTFDLDMKDYFGLTPIDYLLMRGFIKQAQRLCTLNKTDLDVPPRSQNIRQLCHDVVIPQVLQNDEKAIQHLIDLPYVLQYLTINKTMLKMLVQHPMLYILLMAQLNYDNAAALKTYLLQLITPKAFQPEKEKKIENPSWLDDYLPEAMTKDMDAAGIQQAVLNNLIYKHLVETFPSMADALACQLGQHDLLEYVLADEDYDTVKKVDVLRAVLDATLNDQGNFIDGHFNKPQAIQQCVSYIHQILELAKQCLIEYPEDTYLKGIIAPHQTQLEQLYLKALAYPELVLVPELGFTAFHMIILSCPHILHQELHFENGLKHINLAKLERGLHFIDELEFDAWFYLNVLGLNNSQNIFEKKLSKLKKEAENEKAPVNDHNTEPTEETPSSVDKESLRINLYNAYQSADEKSQQWLRVHAPDLYQVIDTMKERSQKVTQQLYETAYLEPNLEKTKAVLAHPLCNINLPLNYTEHHKAPVLHLMLVHLAKEGRSPEYEGIKSIVKFFLTLESLDVNRGISSTMAMKHPQAVKRKKEIKQQTGKQKHVYKGTIPQCMPLHCAVLTDDPELVSAFLSRRDLFIDSKNICGFTPLMLALRYNQLKEDRRLSDQQLEVLKLLCEAGANPNITIREYIISQSDRRKKYKKVTLLHIAIFEKLPRFAKLLLAYGAVPNLADANDFTPFDYALKTQNHELMKVLQEATFTSDENAPTTSMPQRKCRP